MEQHAFYMLETCKSLSENIQSFFDDQLYLENVENPEAITDNFKLDLAIQMVLNELSDMGIDTNIEIEDVLSYSPYFDLMIALRKKFDETSFMETLSSLDDTTYQRLLYIKEDAVCAEDLFLNTVEFFHSIFKMDMDWGRLDSCLLSEHFVGTDAFADYIAPFFRKRDIQDTNRSYITDNNLEAVSKFLQDMEDRDNRVTQMMQDIIPSHPELSKERLQDLIEKYDKDKLSPELLPFFAAWFVLENKPKEEPPFLAHHHATVYHHLQYWENPVNKGKSITKEQAFMIVASMVLDGYDANKRGEEVKAFFQYAEKDVQSILTALAVFTYTEEKSSSIPVKRRINLL